MAYIDDVVTQVQQALVLIGAGFRVPVYLSVMYTKNDLSALESMGTITSMFSMQDLAERYFQGIIDDISYAVGDVSNVDFIVSSAVTQDSSSSILIIVDVYGAADTKKKVLSKKAKSAAYNYTQQQYLDDMALRDQKKSFDR